ncbi:glucuronyl hydrolase [Puteibacter caeruleilacunae]|nr:glucuronyl hydrolase [Puteibacter caeruleilacunae]
MNRSKLLSSFIILMSVLMVTTNGFAKKTNWMKKAVETSAAQLKLAAEKNTPGLNPRSINPDGSMRYAKPRDWTCGFFPGNLWYMYELTGDKAFKKEAARYTEALDSVQYFTHTHDLGFMLYCSYGNGLRLSGKKAYAKVMQRGAKSLSTRFNKNVGCIRSWDFGHWQYPVIVDNMMNLEFMFWASKSTGKDKYRNIAISHANTTLENHFREDYSSYHVVSYDTITGKALEHQTHQGYNDASAWARGQGWGLYGYTLMYRETKDQKYLDQAKHIAAFIMNHPRLPEDKVPYWDFDDPKIPDAPRDASAGALIASALFELSTYVPDGEDYFKFAKTIIKNLSTPKYLAEVGTNKNFILKHSTGNLPNNSEIDTPINYGDYYYLEALKRYKDLRGEGKKGKGKQDR